MTGHRTTDQLPTGPNDRRPVLSVLWADSSSYTADVDAAFLSDEREGHDTTQWGKRRTGIRATRPRGTESALSLCC